MEEIYSQFLAKGKTEWHEPAERPENDGIVLALVKTESGMYSYGFAFFYNDTWKTIFQPYSKVLAWVYLPEPPNTYNVAEK